MSGMCSFRRLPKHRKLAASHQIFGVAVAYRFQHGIATVAQRTVPCTLHAENSRSFSINQGAITSECSYVWLQPEHELQNKAEILALLLRHPQGLFLAQLKDAYKGAEEDIKVKFLPFGLSQVRLKLNLSRISADVL